MGSIRRDSRSLTRRGALAALGAGTARLLGGRQSEVETTEVTTVAWRGRSVWTTSVPTAWYDRERHARSVVSAVRARYADVAGVVDVVLGSAGDPVAGRPTSSIDVLVDPAAGDHARVPEAFDGVPGRLRETTNPKALDGPARASTTVAGGTGLVTEAGHFATATGEVAWRGDRYLLTCAHLFEDADGGCRDVVGRVAYATDGRRVGRVATCDPAQDWALVDVDGSGVGVDGSIAGVPGRVCGRVTAAGLQYLKSEGVAVCKKGAATPERRGRLRAVGVRHGGCDLGDGRSGSRYVDVAVHSVPGDSGGPVYHRFERGGRQYLAVVGLVSARVDCARVSAADGIYSQHDVSFAPSFPLRERGGALQG